MSYYIIELLNEAHKLNYINSITQQPNNSITR